MTKVKILLLLLGTLFSSAAFGEFSLRSSFKVVPYSGEADEVKFTQIQKTESFGKKLNESFYGNPKILLKVTEQGTNTAEEFFVHQDCLREGKKFASLLFEVLSHTQTQRDAEIKLAWRNLDLNQDQFELPIYVDHLESFKKGLLFRCTGEIDFNEEVGIPQLYRMHQEYDFDYYLKRSSGSFLRKIADFLKTPQAESHLQKTSFEELKDLRIKIEQDLKKYQSQAEEKIEKKEDENSESLTLIPGDEHKQEELGQLWRLEFKNEIAVFVKTLNSRLEKFRKNSDLKEEFEATLEAPVSMIPEIIAEFKSHDVWNQFTFEDVSLPSTEEWRRDENDPFGCDTCCYSTVSCLSFSLTQFKLLGEGCLGFFKSFCGSGAMGQRYPDFDRRKKIVLNRTYDFLSGGQGEIRVRRNLPHGRVKVLRPPTELW